MSYHEFSSEELRRIIFKKDTFSKCPACNNEGKVFSDENGCPPLPYPHSDWSDNFQTIECEECDGLGYLLTENHEQ